MTKKQKAILESILEMGEFKAHKYFSEDPLEDLWQRGKPKQLWAVVAAGSQVGCGEVLYNLELESPLFAWESKDIASIFIAVLELETGEKAVVKEVSSFSHPLIYYWGTYILKPGIISTDRDKIVFHKAIEWKPVGSRIGGEK